MTLDSDIKLYLDMRFEAQDARIDGIAQRQDKIFECMQEVKKQQAFDTERTFKQIKFMSESIDGIHRRSTASALVSLVMLALLVGILGAIIFK